MAFKTFVAGDVLTAADVNTYLMKQAVITCTAATRPTGVHGMLIYETDTGRYLSYDSSAWVVIYSPPTVYTPTLSGVVVGSGGTNTATWMQLGSTMHIYGNIVFGSSGQTFPTGTFTIALPSGWTSSEVDGTPVGTARLRDSSVPATFPADLQIISGVLTVLSTTASGTYTQYGGSPSATVPFGAAWASGDSVVWSATLQAAQ